MAGVAAQNLTPCILELGGKCPAVIHPSADLACAADKIAWAKFSNSGQTCVAPDYIFVHESIYDQFERMLIESIKRLWGDVADK